MNLKELISGKDLFTVIESKFPDKFPFIGLDAENLNLMLMVFYGQKPAFTPLAEYSADELASMVVMQFDKTWLDYVSLDGLDLSSSEIRTLTETVNNVEARNETNTGVNKVSAYNTDIMLDNDGSEYQGVNDLTGERVRTLTDNRIDVRNAYKALSSSDKDSIIKSVLNDVSRFLTLSIY